MLTSLYIENYAIVERLDLDLNAGMTTFTGETGAGKSIMIDALALALGNRADSGTVRSGSAKCIITASFSIDETCAAKHWLLEHDMDSEDNEIQLKRTITAEGRSKATINGQPAPLQQVRELSSLLVDIHGQHQHQSLLNHQIHRQQLDEFAGHHGLLEEVKTLYLQCQTLKKEIAKLQANATNLDRQELLTYQVEELNQLDLQPLELEQLDDEHKRLYNAQSHIDTTSQCLQLLNADDAGAINQTLSLALTSLEELPQKESSIQAATDMLNTALINCQEAANEIACFQNQINLDPERLHAIEKRLEVIHDIARKHHIDANQLPQHHQQLIDELNQMTQADEKLETLLKQLEMTEQKFSQAAHRLTLSRQKYAAKLAKKITTTIQQLSMPKGKVEINMTALDNRQAHGIDKVEYLVCTNPGQPLESLSKVASGGELSRISLAIQVITAQKASTPTLLFDEVDVGIGGATATLVGQLLRDLAKRLQVFCVTHQAQVASCAHHHYLVAKHQGKTTQSTMTKLNHTQKIEELARMLGGLTITEHTRSNAEELLSLNCSLEN